MEGDAVTKILIAKDSWQVLGVARGTDIITLKKAYRKLAMAVHPDRCKDEKATEAFRKLNSAYEHLTKPHNVDMNGHSSYETTYREDNSNVNRMPKPTYDKWFKKAPTYDPDIFNDFLRKQMQDEEKRRQAEEEKFAKHGRCAAMTKQGIQCHNKPQSDSDYCQVHVNFDPATYKKPEEPKPLTQCHGKTKKGERCKRKTTGLFCSMHGGAK